MTGVSVGRQRRKRMAVKVRERPVGGVKWWIFTDWKGKRLARYIPQGKQAAEEIARRRQAVDRLDMAVDLPEREQESATIRNQGPEDRVEEERFSMEVLESSGAGDPD